jgi:hypothetical protein
MAKKKQSKKIAFVSGTDLECKGAGRTRKARKLPKGAPNVCFRVRSEESSRGKRHVAELFSGKTGRSLGFIGPHCTIVPTTDQAESSDNLNRMKTEWLLKNCLGVGWMGWDHVKPFKKSIKELEKKAHREKSPRT